MAKSAIVCPLCGVEEPVVGEPIALQAIGLFRCEGCGARYVHGRLVPRVVVDPHNGGRGITWARLRFQDPRTKADEYIADLDPKLAGMLIENILEVVPIDSRAAIALARALLTRALEST